MALFGFGKKKEKVKEKPMCACNGNAVEYLANKGNCCESKECSIQNIKVLGPGCKSCHELKDASVAALKDLGLDIEVEYITDMETIMNYGVMSMPALVINDKVVSMGKALKATDIEELLKNLGYCDPIL